MRRLLAPTLLGAHLLALVCVGAAGWLGYWQLDGWRERRDAEAVDLTRLEPEPLAEVMGPDDAFLVDDVGRPVEVAGVWVPDGTVLVSGREHDGVDGYWVVTPLAVAAADEAADPDAPALPVVRGWVAGEADVPAPPSGPDAVVAWLQPTEGSGEPDPTPGDDVVPQVRTADLIQHVDQDLYGAYAVLDRDRSSSTAGAGMAPADLAELPEAGRFTALRNLLYAVEWWVFGAFAGFVWWRFVRDATARPRAAAGEDTGDGSGEDTEPAAVEHPVPSEP